MNADKIITIARAQIGYHEGRDGNGNWNNHEKYAPEVPGLEWAQGQPWCAVFVSWAAMKAGAADLYPRTASCDVAGAWWKKAGRWSEYPSVGAQVFFGSPADLTHTGIVSRFDDTWVWSIEGNTNNNGSAQGDGVYENKRARRSPHVVGYGHPKFTETVKVPAPPTETVLARLQRIAAQRLRKIKNLRKRLGK